MTMPALQLLLHGTIVLVVGLLAGVPYGRAITAGSSEERIRAWRVAHTGLTSGGGVMIAVASVLSQLGGRCGDSLDDRRGPGSFRLWIYRRASLGSHCRPTGLDPPRDPCRTGSFIAETSSAPSARLSGSRAYCSPRLRRSRTTSSALSEVEFRGATGFASVLVADRSRQAFQRSVAGPVARSRDQALTSRKLAAELFARSRVGRRESFNC